MRSGILALAVIAAACSSSTTRLRPRIRRRLRRSSRRIAQIRSGRKRISAYGIRSAVNPCAGDYQTAAASGAPTQNFLKHSLPEPSSALQSAAVALRAPGYVNGKASAVLAAHAPIRVALCLARRASRPSERAVLRRALDPLVTSHLLLR